MRNQDINDVLATIAAESARAAVIVLGAELDLALQEVLKTFFLPQNDVSKKYGFSLFGPDEAAGSFSARIELAYRAGLISDWCQAELHLMRKIRNEFAHRPTGFTFTHSPVRDLIGQLRFPKEILEKHANLWDEPSANDPKERLLLSGGILLAELHVLYLNLLGGYSERIRHCTREFRVAGRTGRSPNDDEEEDPFEPDGVIGGFSDLETYLDRLVQSFADPKVLMLAAQDHPMTLVFWQKEDILRLSFVDEWSGKRDSGAAIRQFFAERQSGLVRSYVVVPANGPDAKRYLTYEIPADPQFIKTLVEDLLYQVYRLRKEDRLHFRCDL